MLVKVFTSINEFNSFNIQSDSIKEILGNIKFEKGKPYTDNIIYTPHSYTLVDEKTEEKLTLIPEVLESKLDSNKTLYIMPIIDGEIPVPIILAATLASVSGLTMATATLTLAIIGDIAIVGTLAAGAMMMLSPTPTINSDAASAQDKKGSLFNNTPPIREQGGVIPLGYGNPFCTGVLISSGLTTTEGSGAVTV